MRIEVTAALRYVAQKNFERSNIPGIARHERDKWRNVSVAFANLADRIAADAKTKPRPPLNTHRS